MGGLFDNLIISLVSESLSTKVPEEPEMDPCNYNEAIHDNDATLWQKIIKIEIESMYSNSSMVFSESTWWGKTHRLQVDLQEQEKDRLEGENLSGIASGEGVTPKKKVFNTFQPIANNLSGFSHPLYLIGTMRYREWMLR